MITIVEIMIRIIDATIWIVDIKIGIVNATNRINNTYMLFKRKAEMKIV